MKTFRKIFRNYGGYLLLVAWFGALAGLGYFAHTASQDARAELLSGFFPKEQVRLTTGTPEVQAREETKEDFGGELKVRLSEGLDTLTNILKDLQTKTASAAE